MALGEMTCIREGVSAPKTFRQQKVAETSSAILLPKRLVPKRPEPVVPSKNLGLKLTDQQLRISLSLRLGSKICEKHTCRCGKLVEENGHLGFSCARSAGRFSRGWAEIGRRNGIENQSKSSGRQYQIFEWDRNNSDRNFYNVVRYVHIPLVP